MIRSERTWQKTLVGLGIALGVGAGCSQNDDSRALLADLERAGASSARPKEADTAEVNPRLLRRFEPLRKRFDAAANPSTPARVALGRMLYYEKRLSKAHDLSCNSCHDLARYGVDGEAKSPGHRGQRGARNSPSVYNAAGAFVQFWDGRSPDVEAQAAGPILNPVEMAAPNGEHVVRVLRSMPAYVTAFESAFPGEKAPVTLDNVGRALGAFERGLTTRARWDDYLEGKKDALTPAEVDGLKTFTNVGCMVCHTGELLGGSTYQKVGAVAAWPNQADPGRFEVTKNEADRMVFRVPSLRNVSKTAPYFHDGSGATLPDAVRKMGKHQLGVELTDREVAAIVTWLDSLTGDIPSAYIAPPELPPSGASTPKPDPR